jgi:hypothetical protein
MSIDNDGYIIIKNILTAHQLQKGLACDHGNIDYKSMKGFIDQEFLPTIQKNVCFMTNPIYVKFRYSNNNNSTDASTFHSDVYNFTSLETIPIYTCLCYFDKTQMELIPGSHKKEFKSNHSSITSYFTKKVIDIQPGDILIFHSNLYHRGTNFNTENNRRVLQVFDVFPNQQVYNENISKLITVTSSKKSNVIGQLSYYISKVPVIIDTVTFIHYILVYNDLQYKIVLNDIEPSKKENRFITYEPGQTMDYNDKEGPINTNIICRDRITIEPSNYYLYMFILFLFFLIFIVFIFNRPLKIKKRRSKLIRSSL